MVDYLGEITQHMQVHIPTDFLLNFEKAAMNSAEMNFNRVDIKSCFFHHLEEDPKWRIEAAIRKRRRIFNVNANGSVFGVCANIRCSPSIL